MELGRAWDATVTLAPDIKSNIPFLGSSRRGSGVVVSLDGTGSSQSRIILTAAHVACLAGSRNAIRVRRPGATDDGDGAVAKVVGVHPRLDLAVLAFAAGDQGEDGSRNSVQSDERAWLPMATSPVRDGDVVAALGYPMGWSGAIKNISSIARRGQTRAGTWGEVLATYAPMNDDSDSDTETVTHVLHTSTVASGESGGPLVNGKMEVCGVHSFGDAFQGGERDVAVAVSSSMIARLCSGLTGGVNGAGSELEACSLKPVGCGAYETSMVNAMIMESSDPALAAMCPELTRTQRMSWIM